MFDALIIFSAKYLFLISVATFIGYGFFTKRKKDFLLFAVLVLPVSFLLGILANHFFYNPRPFVVSNVIPLIAHVADNGFPSDHALLTSTLAVIISVFDVPVAIFLWLLAILVGGARVLAHIHHTIDIIGSYTIAIISVVIMYPLISKLRAQFARVLDRFGINIK